MSDQLNAMKKEACGPISKLFFSSPSGNEEKHVISQ